MIEPCHQAEAAAATALPAALPEWDLGDLYEAPTAPDVTRDLRDALAAAAALAAEHKGKLAELDGAGARRGDRALRADRGAARPGASATPSCCTPRRPTTRRSGASSRPCRSGSTRPAPASCSSRSRSTGSTMRRSPPRSSNRRGWPGTSPGCATCARSARISSTTRSSACCTRSRSPGAAPGSACSTRPWPGCASRSSSKELTSAEIFDLLSDKDRSKRAAAAQSIAGVLERNTRLFALITNTLAKDKQIEDGWRRFPRPISSRNLANQVEDEVVDALIGCGPRRLPAPVASLLRDQGALARARAARVLGPQRALARGRRPPGGVAGRQGDRARRLPALLAAARGHRRAVLRRQLDRCGAAPGQGCRRVLPSDRAERAPLCADELPGPRARRDDARARARARRPSGACGGARPADGGHARSRSPRPRRCSASS